MNILILIRIIVIMIIIHSLPPEFCTFLAKPSGTLAYLHALQRWRPDVSIILNCLGTAWRTCTQERTPSCKKSRAPATRGERTLSDLRFTSLPLRPALSTWYLMTCLQTRNAPCREHTCQPHSGQASLCILVIPKLDCEPCTLIAISSRTLAGNHDS